MKLRARFPQIGIALPDSVASATRGTLRRAFWPTSRNGTAALPEPAAAQAAVLAPVSAATPLSRRRSRVTDWVSTMAVWRSPGQDGEP